MTVLIYLLLVHTVIVGRGIDAALCTVSPFGCFTSWGAEGKVIRAEGKVIRAEGKVIRHAAKHAIVT